MILKLGSKNVALLKGCFCRLFSDIGVGAGGTPVSGSVMDRAGIGEPDGEELPEAVGEAATSRLNPKPNRPEMAFKVPPTVELMEGGEEVLGSARDEPAPGVSVSTTGSKRLFAPPPTALTELATMSRSLFPKVGFGGGGGGLRIPFEGGFGRRRAGEGFDDSLDGENSVNDDGAIEGRDREG